MAPSQTMKTYYVRARSNHYTITYAYLVQDKTAALAVEKLRIHLIEKKVPCTALKRARMATEYEVGYFKRHQKAVIK
jgi:hypothetical protein